METPSDKLAYLFLSLLLLAGCGGSDCSSTAINISPPSASADHSASPPANANQFFAFPVIPSGCSTIATAAALRNVTWSVSDPINVNISNAQDATFGVAT